MPGLLPWSAAAVGKATTWSTCPKRGAPTQRIPESGIVNGGLSSRDQWSTWRHAIAAPCGHRKAPTSAIRRRGRVSVGRVGLGLWAILRLPLHLLQTTGRPSSVPLVRRIRYGSRIHRKGIGLRPVRSSPESSRDRSCKSQCTIRQPNESRLPLRWWSWSLVWVFLG